MNEFKWLECACGSKRVHLITEYPERRCSCCGGAHTDDSKFMWRVWCYKCDRWTELFEEPLAAIKDFLNGGGEVI